MYLPAFHAVALLTLSSSTLTHAQIPLRSAAGFAVLAGQSITNTGSTTDIIGDVALYPNTNTSITGFTSDQISGSVYAGNDVARIALQDAQTAYDAAKLLTPTGQTYSNELGNGQTIRPGVYKFSSSGDINGALTLDAANDPNALFVFQIGTTLTMASASSVVLLNGARACNVFWQVGSSATLGEESVLQGRVLAAATVTAGEGVTVQGVLLGLEGSVTLIGDGVSAAGECDVVAISTTVASTTTSSSPVGGGYDNTPTLIGGYDSTSTALSTVSSVVEVDYGSTTTPVSTTSVPERVRELDHQQ